MTITSVAASNTTPSSMLTTAVTGAIGKGITSALGAAGLSGYSASSQVADAVDKISKDVVSTLQSSPNTDASAALSKIISSDVGSVLNQYGMGSYATSSLVAGLVKSLSDNAMTAAQSVGYGQAPALGVTAASSSAAPATQATPSSTPASNATASSVPSDTAALILKALAPLTGTRADLNKVVSDIANRIEHSNVANGTGSILTSVASGLRQKQENTATTAATSASNGSATSTPTTQADANVDKSGTTSSAFKNTLSSTTNLASASKSHANTASEEQSLINLSALTNVVASTAKLAAISLQHPLVYAYSEV